MMRRFLNLVVECLDTGLYSLRRINLSSDLFYPSATAAEAAMARSEAAIKANAEKQTGYKHGFRSLETVASRLEQLPGALINFKPSGPYRMSVPSIDLVSLLGDESKIFWSDTLGLTSLYDADSHSLMTVPNLTAPKGHGAIPISITRAAAHGSPVEQSHSLYVMGRMIHREFGDNCFEELSYEGGQDVFCANDLFRGWCSLPRPPIYKLPNKIDAYTVVGGTIYVSSTTPGIGTYAFDTEIWKWRPAGNWCLPFSGKAEYVPELKLWIGLSATCPFHLCASDLSAVDFERPPTVHQTWVDFDMPKSWSLFQKDLINLGSGRFCVVKMFRSTMTPQGIMGFSDDEDSDDDETLDFCDAIRWDFAVLTGIELVVASPGKLRMLKHMSKYHTFEDYAIRWVL
ncbi:hypothetical protein BDA96_01G043400 [Sorghum bicolor]|uniref:Uncharacterized protein n=1 Tax=Sorghum bicolor TaxID=4558 RepID=A0A921RVR5_SORBI|nr:hypothetical protein BDA96_01G043400 [Sorghum bicolor]KAG0547021.1 hypothetical protein BDA96_01G043400 [Sorghum bicolor]KAG0547022.1 hypothetical protein BDA96_01G043400 [Sorghum bicolor]KAG0547023.1 hypothetical protein BDA96_01G043400 [Sorghum bicolor]